MKKTILTFLIAAAFLASGLFAYRMYFNSQNISASTESADALWSESADIEFDVDSTQDIADEYPWLNGVAESVTIDDEDVALKHPVTVYLAVGTDGSGNENGIGDDYLGDLADFLALLVIDTVDRKYSIIEINRNTMTDVPLMDYYGNSDDTGYMQICMAHAYGSNREMGCRNVCDAVSALFGGLEIDGYISVSMEYIQTINNAAGGVTVTIEDDFSNEDSSLVMGEEVTLSDEQAVHYLRGRMNVGDGTNECRMRRQRTYLKAMSKKLTSKGDDVEYLSDFFTTIKDVSVSNISLEDMILTCESIQDYTDMGIYSISGENEEQDSFGDGVILAEFYPYADSINEVLEEVLPLEEH